MLTARIVRPRNQVADELLRNRFFKQARKDRPQNDKRKCLPDNGDEGFHELKYILFHEVP